MIEEEEEEGEEEGLPVSHKPDVEPPPPIRQDSGQTPPDEEPTAAALSNQDDTDSPDRSLNKVCRLTSKSAEVQRCFELRKFYHVDLCPGRVRASVGKKSSQFKHFKKLGDLMSVL